MDSLVYFLMEQSYDHKEEPLAECVLLERVTLTGISEAMLRFLFQDRTSTYLAALIFVPVPILSYIKLLVAGHMMRLI